MIFGNTKASPSSLSELGQVEQIAPDFRTFATEFLMMPRLLPYTKGEFMGLPEEERKRRKRCGYFTQATFSQARRVTANASGLGCVALDIDNPDDAITVVGLRLGDVFSGFSVAAYYTASSVPSHLRLRVVVDAQGLPLERFLQAHAWIAQRLGIKAAAPESERVVQPMYLPVQFKDDADPLYYLAFGRALRSEDVAEAALPSGHNASAQGSAILDDSGLDKLRPPMPGVEHEDAQEALAFLSPDCPRKEWVEIGAALKHQFGEEGFELWDEWSQQSDKYPGEDEMAIQWRSLRVNASGDRRSVTFRSLLRRARDAGMDARAGAVVMKSLITSLKMLEDKDDALGHGVDLIAKEYHDLLGAELDQASKCLAKIAKVSVVALKNDVKREAKRYAAKRLDKSSREGGKDDTEVPAWARGWVYVAETQEFFRKSTGEKVKPQAMDDMHGKHFIDGDTTDLRATIRPRDYLLNRVCVPSVSNYLYAPDSDLSVVTVGQKKFVNTYLADYPDPESDPFEVAETYGIILHHLERMIREPEYVSVFVDWMAYQVQFPGRKVNWAPVLQGAPGCGKTTIAHWLAQALGATNVFVLPPDTLIERSWTEWMTGHQVVAIEEIRVPGEKRHAVMNRLKPAITNARIAVDQRHRDTAAVENKTNYLLFTNHHDALPLDDDDRRYFIVEAMLQTRLQVESMGREYFKSLYSLAPGAVRAALLGHKIRGIFDPLGHAPRTIYHRAMVSATRSPMQEEVLDLVRGRDHPMVNEKFMSLTTVAETMRMKGFGPTMCTVGAIRALVRGLGLTIMSEPMRIRGTSHLIAFRTGDEPPTVAEIEQTLAIIE